MSKDRTERVWKADFSSALRKESFCEAKMLKNVFALWKKQEHKEGKGKR